METSLTAPARSILWRPTAALASVNAAITLGWIIYRVHLAGILTQAGFSASFAPGLLLIESILAIGIEPWAGSASDRTGERLGGRFYIIGIGAGITAFLFLVLPGIVDRLPADAAANWWLPVVLVLWAVAISMFRSPALAFLEEYATRKDLPMAASLITLAGAIAGSATPLASPWLLSLGVAPTFVAAALIIVGTVGWFKMVQPLSRQTIVPPRSFPPGSVWLPILIAGLSVTLVFRLAIELYPKLLKAAGLQPPLFMGSLFISLAIGAILAGQLTIRWGRAFVIQLGYGLTAACLLLMLLPKTTVDAALIAIGFGLSFSLLFNNVLPWVFTQIGDYPTHRHSGLGVGLFFAGAAAASSLYSGILSSISWLTPSLTIGLAIVSLLVASLCMTLRWSDRQSST
ncbi:MAG: MFS transporter [Elainella sp. Prado103]|jgi:MFS family permease|nr:MFS transporter [Elainella sp. Prado103]